MREEPALTRDKILSYSLTAPVIDNVRAGPEVAGAATATGALGRSGGSNRRRSGGRYRRRSGGSNRSSITSAGAAAAIGAAAPGAAAAAVAGRGAAAATGSDVGTIGPGGGGRLVGAVVDCCWGAVGRTTGHA